MVTTGRYCSYQHRTEPSKTIILEEEQLGRERRVIFTPVVGLDHLDDFVENHASYDCVVLAKDRIGALISWEANRTRAP